MPTPEYVQAMEFGQRWAREFHEGHGVAMLAKYMDRDRMVAAVFGEQNGAMSAAQRQQAGEQLVAIAGILYDNSLAKQASVRTKYDTFVVRGRQSEELAVSYRATLPNYVRNDVEIALWRPAAAGGSAGADDWLIRDVTVNGRSFVRKLSADYAADAKKGRPDVYLERLREEMTQQHRRDVAAGR